MLEWGGCVPICDIIEDFGLFVNTFNELKLHKLYNCDSNHHRNLLEVNVAHKVAKVLFYKQSGQFAHKSLQMNSYSYSSILCCNSLFIQIIICFICAIKASATKWLISDCPPTFAPFRGKCYRADAVSFNYENAQQICTKMGLAWVGGGQLAEPRHLETTLFLSGIIRRLTNIHYISMIPYINIPLKTQHVCLLNISTLIWLKLHCIYCFSEQWFTTH